MEKWELRKEEFEKCKKQAVERVVEKFFPDIEREEKLGYGNFLKSYLMSLSY